MKLAALKKLDQKNRLHIPYEYLKFLNIPENDYVKVSLDVESNKIIIEPMELTEVEKYMEETACDIVQAFSMALWGVISQDKSDPSMTKAVIDSNGIEILKDTIAKISNKYGVLKSEE